MLQTVDRLPVPNKTMVQESRFLSILEKWLSSTDLPATDNLFIDEATGESLNYAYFQVSMVLLVACWISLQGNGFLISLQGKGLSRIMFVKLCPNLDPWQYVQFIS